MTIKDIAEISGVSPSTVSKIINGKDKDISSETREKVLSVVKKYNYRPYASVISGGKNFSNIGILIKYCYENMDFSKGISDVLKDQGYTAIILYYNDFLEEESQIKYLLSKNLDGLIWQPYSEESCVKLSKLIQKVNFPIKYFDAGRNIDKDNITFNFYAIGYRLTEELINFKHEKITCIIDETDISSKNFVKGYLGCISKNNISNKNIFIQKKDDLSEVFFDNTTGIISQNISITSEIYKLASKYKRKIPKDLSIITIGSDYFSDTFNPRVSNLELPSYKLGQEISNSITSKIEKKIYSFNPDIKLIISGETVDVPITVRGKKILVVGTLNMDTFVTIDSMPKSGETYTVNNYEQMPGGKGLNQAIGVARLGGEAYIIGSIGQDYEGKIISNLLSKENISIDGIRIDKKTSTGSAYVYVEPDGESGILVSEGANAELTADNIEEKSYLFDNSSFCLIQTESRMEAVKKSIEIANRKNIKTIVKPSAINEIDDNLLEKIDILVPNKKELDRISKTKGSYKDKIDELIKRGANLVIVTLDKEGCFYKNKFGDSAYFPAANFEAVDTTGAADAFISALAVFLTEGYDLEESIKNANFAAGFSITKRGVPNSLVDRATFNQMIGII